MIRLSRLVLGLALFPLVAHSADAPATDAAPMPGMAMSHAETPAAQAMMEGMRRMQREMAAAPMTGDADRDFVSMMAPHHAGAIDMAKLELQYGHDPALLELARGIVAAQEKEIAFMSAWQAAHPAK